MPTESLSIRETSPQWFAGALEAGGTVHFGIQRRKNGHISAYPYISFREPNEPFIDALKAEFGGSKSPAADSWDWKLGGHKAAEIMAAMEPYTVSRREISIAAQNWLESDRLERVQIAQAMKGRDRFDTEFSPEDY